MSNPSSVQLKFQEDTCQKTKERSDGMLTNVKGVNGGLGWLASTARPDMAAPHSIIPSGYYRRSTQLISEVNAAVKQCHAVPTTITIWPIPLAELRWTTFTWIPALWESMTWRDFDILTQRRSSRPLKTMMPHVIRNENPAYYDPESTPVMDSKGLFDALDNDLPQDDRKICSAQSKCS